MVRTGKRRKRHGQVLSLLSGCHESKPKSRFEPDASEQFPRALPFTISSHTTISRLRVGPRPPHHDHHSLKPQTAHTEELCIYGTANPPSLHKSNTSPRHNPPYDTSTHFPTLRFCRASAAASVLGSAFSSAAGAGAASGKTHIQQ